MSVDLAYQRERMLWVNQISSAPNPTTLILQAAGTYTGVLANGLAVANTCRLQDVNTQNVAGNTTALGWTTYQHYFTTIGTRFLFDLTDNSVYDLTAYDQRALIVRWPSSF